MLLLTPQAAKWQTRLPIFGLSLVLYLFLNLSPERFPEWGPWLSNLKMIFCSLFFSVLIANLFIAFFRSEIPRPLLKNSLFYASLVFSLLCVLSFPYTYPENPLTHPSGLASLGSFYGDMSKAPFDYGGEFVFRRLLGPTLAYFMNLRGDRYFLFSILCSFALVLLTVFSIERRFTKKTPPPQLWLRLLAYSSFLTGTYLFHSLQAPGYPEHLGYCLILLLVCFPMNSRERLGLIPLCIATHDGLAFPLAGIVLTLYPREERIRALSLIALYFIIFAAVNLLHLESPLAGHHIVGEYSRRFVWALRPGIGLAGIFLAFKLFWIPLVGLSWQDYRLRGRPWNERLRLPTLLCSSGLILFLAWDVSRLMGFAFFAGWLILAGLLENDHKLTAIRRRSLVALMTLNLLIPTYSIELNLWTSPERRLTYPYPGLYHWIDRKMNRMID